jgi:hypothetical protein
MGDRALVTPPGEALGDASSIRRSGSNSRNLGSPSSTVQRHQQLAVLRHVERRQESNQSRKHSDEFRKTCGSKTIRKRVRVACAKRSRAPLGLYDVLIAGQARARELTLVTHNTTEFERYVETGSGRSSLPGHVPANVREDRIHRYCSVRIDPVPL